jgi:Uma2 family endonuclease
MSGAAAKRLVEIEYPSSDGKPMAETDQHRDDMVALIEGLKARYASRADVYVAGNLLVYYEEGNPKARFAPDVFVVLGVPRRRRRVYKLWEEKRPPSVVIEVTSRGTWLEDEGKKKALYGRLGVAEYYLYDPLGEYLEPPLQGLKLEAGAYVPMRRGADDSLASAALGMKLKLEDGRLRLTDLATGAPMLRPEELEAARQNAEAARQNAEARATKEESARVAADTRAEAAEARARAAEAELTRLRARRK